MIGLALGSIGLLALGVIAALELDLKWRKRRGK